MKKIFVRAVILLFAVALGIFIARKSFPGKYMTISGFTQGTTYHISYQSKKGIDLQNDIDSLLARFDQSLSSYIKSSIISRVNRNEPGVKLDTFFVDVFRKSYEVYKTTNGAFDITVGPIVDALGFGPTEGVNVDSALIDSLMLYVGMDKVKIENGHVVKKYKETLLDVNALAQGYSVDVVCHFLDNKHIKNYLVEIGGEVRAKGKNNKGELWRVGVDKPIENNQIPGADLQAIIELNNQALATSGNYRKFYVKNGIKYTHTINPKTGYPVLKTVLSASVVANDCITADAYATAFMVMGFEKTKAFLASHPELDAYLITGTENGKYNVFVTKNLKKYIEEESLTAN